MHAKVENGVVTEYPITNLRHYLRNVSLPEDLSKDSNLPEGYVYVHAAPPPNHNRYTHRAVAQAPVLLDGKWYAQYSLEALSETEIAINFNKRKAQLRERVDDVRDEMVNAGCTYNGVEFQTRPQDRENIAGAVQLAVLARLQGQPFETNWISADNSLHILDDEDVIALGQIVARRKAELIFRGRETKDAIDLAEDFDSLPDVDLWMHGGPPSRP